MTPLAASAQWSYAKVPDEMRKTTAFRARLISLNSHQFTFPYSGGSRLSLVVWFHKDRPEDVDRHDISLFLSKGQFSCHSNDVCAIHVKVDDGEIEPFSAELSDDFGLMWLTGNGQARLLEAFKSGKQLTIEVPVYQHGERQFKFGLSPLRWPK